MMFKNLVLTVLFFLILMMSALASALNNRTWLVLDAQNNTALPSHFRTTSDPIADKLDITGFRELHAIGSGQFSKRGLAQVLKTLASNKITIVDLRQESHGFVNGSGISWFGNHNANNSKLNAAKIESVQAKLLAAIENSSNVTIVKILHKTPEEIIDKVEPIYLNVHQVLSEKELAFAFHLSYLRLYIQDFHKASDLEVDRFLEIVKSFPKNEWIYFHCRAGIGRTTQFMMMYDIFHNAKKVSLDTILKRNIAIGGKDLSALPDKHDYKYQSSLDRWNFIQAFYEYARTNQDAYRTPWSQWQTRLKE